ncbi:T9SS type A sorting domain-containing protein [Vicingus serpentipes]|uniref:T9SS type A sorting domain-containing protein n=1 Tax=Vicingus serpentipes TaxID=1926625 RepID=A0A5C6RVX0_9FLAO|nr:M43 family zinc metalloprotease [Vicingus serpentipes]TXB66696.1 T9SS type A sorting domain-containing protein [Vicingus serpentipes]
MKKSTLLLSSLVLSAVLVFGQNSRKAGPILNTQTVSNSVTLNEERAQEMINSAERTADGKIRCFSTEYNQLLKEAYPGIASTEEFEAWIAPKVAEYQAQKANGTAKKAVITVPIIMHIIHNSTESVGQGRNISQAQATSQITILNDDFRRLNADASNTPAAFLPVAADLEINFVPALRYASNHPLAGQTLAEPGINRVSTADIAGINNTTNGYGTATIDATIKPATYWDRTEVMNVWVCQIQGGILGYAQFPSSSGLGGLNTNGGNANTDGLVLGYTYTGTGGVTQAPFNKGRTATHELGHWAGLRHIWGDGACGTDDFVADTPESDAANYGCTSTHSSCGSTDMVQNYMDYSDDGCMNLFTEGQKARVVQVFANSPGRAELPTSTLGGSLVATANFTGAPLVINEGASVTFTDASTSPDNLNSWTWSFPGGTPSSFVGQTPPAITYATQGLYSVTLTIGDDNGGADSETKTDYITVNPAGTAICDSTVAGWDWNTENFGGSYWTQDAAACNLPLEGYVAGNNCYDDNGWASKMSSPGAGKELVEVRYVFIQSTGTGTGNLKIWDADGAGGSPNTVLASAPITTGQFSANLNQFISLPITPAIDLDLTSPSFFIGYDHDVTPLDGDTIVMGLAAGTTGNNVWANEVGGWLDLATYGTDSKGTVVAIVCDKTTGVESHTSELSSIVAYPNPTTGIVEVMLPANNANVAVFNMIGEEVANSSTTSNMLKIDLSAQPNGVYFIKVTSNGEVTTKKILLSK